MTQIYSRQDDTSLRGSQCINPHLASVWSLTMDLYSYSVGWMNLFGHSEGVGWMADSAKTAMKNLIMWYFIDQPGPEPQQECYLDVAITFEELQ